IFMHPGDLITFKVMIDTNGLAGPLQEFKYQVTYDRVELEFINANLDPNGKFGTDENGNPNPGGNLHNQTFNVTHTGGAVPANTAAFVLDEFTFKARAKDSSGFGLDNSGERDFYISILNAKILVAGALVEVNQQFGSQEVEVQPYVPLPASAWMGLSLLATLAISRRFMNAKRPAVEIPIA
ncbi:MAG: hypothetical protein IT441_11165, partial [Phycisphaeraceae bacterium]|nr:hypothetical protein [Phycisphaeraceae bacterium]